MANILDRSRKVSRRQRLQRIWLDRSGYLLRGIEKKPRNLNRRGLYRGGVKKVLKRYRLSVESPEEEISRRRNNTR